MQPFFIVFVNISTQTNKRDMTIKDTRKQLQIGIDKYLISNTFYNFLITQTNAISDYRQCKAFVRRAVNNALNGEVEEVRAFNRNKIDFEL